MFLERRSNGFVEVNVGSLGPFLVSLWGELPGVVLVKLFRLAKLHRVC